MRIISLNAWGGKIHEPLIDYLGASGADVVCLQEVTRTTGVASGWLEYRDGSHILPQRANLFDETKAALPEHDGIFAPASRGELFDGDEPVRSEFGLATFVHRSLAIAGQAMDFVHGSFSPDGYGAHPRPRNAQVLRLFDYATGRPLVVAQMHGLRDMAGKGDTPERIAQAEALVALIARIRRDGDPLVVCGDLNVLPDSATFEILGRLGLTELVTSGGFDGTRTSLYPKDGRFADYMLVSPDVNVSGFDVVRQPEVSDHCALLLDIA